LGQSPPGHIEDEGLAKTVITGEEVEARCKLQVKRGSWPYTSQRDLLKHRDLLSDRLIPASASPIL